MLTIFLLCLVSVRTLKDQKNETTPWPSRLNGSPPIPLLQHSFNHYQHTPPLPEPEDDDDVEEDDGTTVNEPGERHNFESRTRNTLVSRSSVTLVSDFPTYELAAFKKKMNALKNRQVSSLPFLLLRDSSLAAS